MTQQTHIGAWIDCTFMQDIDAEIASIQNEIQDINTERIPWDKIDITITACAGIIGAAFDAVSHLGNSSKNPIGKAGDKIHKSNKLAHGGQPIDYREKIDGVSFGRVEHRFFAGHDIGHYNDLVNQMKDGEFRAGGFVGGSDDQDIYKYVSSKVNSAGKEFIKMSKEDAKKELNKHLLADFFSPEGLPMPWTTDIWKYCTTENIAQLLKPIIKILEVFHVPQNKINIVRNIQGHDIRKKLLETYKNGVNLRSEVSKGFAFILPEIICQLTVGIRYKHWFDHENQEYQQDTIKRHQQKMLLIAHSIVALTNLGFIIATKNPCHINIATLVRVFHLGIQCVKNDVDFNSGVKTKAELSNLLTNMLEYKTIVICANGLYLTNNHLDSCANALNVCQQILVERNYYANYLSQLLSDNKNCSLEMFDKIQEDIDNLPADIQEETLLNLVNTCQISDNEIPEKVNFEKYIKYERD